MPQSLEQIEQTDQLNQGVVFKKLLGQYTVQTDNGPVICSISSVLRKELVHPTSAPWSGGLRRVQAVKDIRTVDPIAIGDVVGFLPAGDGTGMIKEVMPRKNKLARRAAGLRELEQVIVSNVDQIVPIVSAAQPKPRWRLLDRYLAMAEAADIRVLICMTKMDLVRGKRRDRFMELVQIYEDIGYEVVLTSAETGEGIMAFEDIIRGRTSVLVGMSGVGKTSLLNAIQPELGLRVKEISQAARGPTAGRGQHTTTHLEMFPLNIGGNIVDTPGMKTLGLWEIENEDLASLFVEMEPYVGTCKFRLDCTHTHEPDCSIKDAVAAGEISEFRYKSYLWIRDEMSPKEK